MVRYAPVDEQHDTHCTLVCMHSVGKVLYQGVELVAKECAPTKRVALSEASLRLLEVMRINALDAAHRCAQRLTLCMRLPSRQMYAAHRRLTEPSFRLEHTASPGSGAAGKGPAPAQQTNPMPKASPQPQSQPAPAGTMAGNAAEAGAQNASPDFCSVREVELYDCSVRWATDRFAAVPRVPTRRFWFAPFSEGPGKKSMSSQSRGVIRHVLSEVCLRARANEQRVCARRLPTQDPLLGMARFCAEHCAALAQAGCVHARGGRAGGRVV
jgi:hypothetical protein